MSSIASSNKKLVNSSSLSQIQSSQSHNNGYSSSSSPSKRKTPPPALNLRDISCLPEVFTFKAPVATPAQRLTHMNKPQMKQQHTLGDLSYFGDDDDERDNNGNNLHHNGDSSSKDWVDSILQSDDHQSNIDEFNELYIQASSSPTIPIDSPGVEMENIRSVLTDASPVTYTTINNDKTNTLVNATSNDRFKVYNLIKSGLEVYIKVLNMSVVEVVKPRVDFLIDYLFDKSGTRYRPKFIFEYLSFLKTDSKFETLKMDLQKDDFLDDLRVIYNESERTRKSYNNKNKRLNNEKERQLSFDDMRIPLSNSNAIASTTTNNSNASPLDSRITPSDSSYMHGLDSQISPNDTSYISIPNMKSLSSQNNSLDNNNKISSSQPTNGTRRNRASTMNSINDTVSVGVGLNKLKIAFQSTQQSTAKVVFNLANVENLLQVIGDSSYIETLLSSKQFLVELFDKSRLNLSWSNMSHTLMHTSIPFTFESALSHDTSIEKGRFISFADIHIDADTCYPPNQDADFFSHLVYFKLVSTMYDKEDILYHISESVTGYYIENKTKIRINLPLNHKFWSGIINEYQNGSIDQFKVDDLLLVHSIYTDEQFMKSKNHRSPPVYSFIWEFKTGSSSQSMQLPHSVIIPKSKSKKNSVSASNQNAKNNVRNPFYTNNNNSSGSLGNNNRLLVPNSRGHKRTRSKSLTGLDDLVQSSQTRFQQLQQQQQQQQQQSQYLRVQSQGFGNGAHHQSFSYSTPQHHQQYQQQISQSQSQSQRNSNFDSLNFNFNTADLTVDSSSNDTSNNESSIFTNNQSGLFNPLTSFESDDSLSPETKQVYGSHQQVHLQQQHLSIQHANSFVPPTAPAIQSQFAFNDKKNGTQSSIDSTVASSAPASQMSFYFANSPHVQYTPEQHNQIVQAQLAAKQQKYAIENLAANKNQQQQQQQFVVPPRRNSSRMTVVTASSAATPVSVSNLNTIDEPSRQPPSTLGYSPMASFMQLDNESISHPTQPPHQQQHQPQVLSQQKDGIVNFPIHRQISFTANDFPNPNSNMTTSTPKNKTVTTPGQYSSSSITNGVQSPSVLASASKTVYKLNPDFKINFYNGER